MNPFFLILVGERGLEETGQVAQKSSPLKLSPKTKNTYMSMGYSLKEGIHIRNILTEIGIMV